LQKSLGVVTAACAIVKINRWTFYDWYNNDPEFRKEVDDCKDIALDFAETALFRQIKENTPASTIFFLKTKGKHRGYVETVHQNIKSENVNYQVPVDEDSKVRLQKVLRDIDDGDIL
jgi:hypothetical protein